jgi:glycosyltransferase involved in cell wall biosynthesis
MKNNKTLIILDSKNYSKKEQFLRKKLSTLCIHDFFYTDYENNIIKYFHSLKVGSSFFTHISYWFTSLLDAIRICKDCKSYNTKIFINPIVGIFYAFLTRVIHINNEKIVISGFLFENKKNQVYLFFRKLFVNFCYKKVYKIIVYSKNEVYIYSNIFPDLSSKFYFVEYGRDFNFREIQNSNILEKYIASGGISNRDFNTLAVAMNCIEGSDVVCKIATRPHSDFTNFNNKNIEVLYNVRLEDFGNFLANSLFVVIPLKNTTLSAGHMALMEAMSLGKIILIADVEGVRDYVDERTVFFYEPESPVGLKEKILYLINNLQSSIVKNRALLAYDFYYNNYTFDEFLYRVVKKNVDNFL